MKIKDIPKNERPIERLIQMGASTLSNEDLLSILIRCGTRDKSSKELSLQILKDVKNITELKNATVNSLEKIKGIGKSKAAIIVAACELGKRINSQNNIDNKSYTTSFMLFKSFKYLFDKKQEYFYALYFDNRQHLIGKEKLFIGTVNKSIVHPREIFKYAYLYSASGIICMHNHPSGDSSPSIEDKNLTKIIKEIADINKIPLLDHIIIGDDNYYSFRDNGQIK